MTTNGEWLDYLAQNAPDELSAWFDAEHTESPTSETMQHIGQVIENTIKRGVYGDTDAQNADSREQLEADVYRAADEMDRFYCGEKFIDTRKIIGWLDRQAAITAEETNNAWEEYRDATQREITKLTAELDKERKEYVDLNNITLIANNKCDMYRSMCNEMAMKIQDALAIADEGLA